MSLYVLNVKYWEVYLSFSVLGFCINSVAACIIWRRPKEFNPSNWLVLSMILYSISILPFSAMWHKNTTWEYGAIMCRIQAHLRWWLSFVISHFCCFGLFVVYLRRLQNYFTPYKLINPIDHVNLGIQRVKRFGPYCIIVLNFLIATVNAYYFRVDVFKKDYCFNQLELVGFENNIDEGSDVQPLYLSDHPKEAISLKTYRFIELFMHYFLPLTIAASIIFSLLIEVTFRPVEFRRSYCGTGEFVIFAVWFFCWTPYACYQNIAISSDDEEKYFRSDDLVRPILEFIGHLNIILQPLIIIIGRRNPIYDNI